MRITEQNEQRMVIADPLTFGRLVYLLIAISLGLLYPVLLVHYTIVLYLAVPLFFWLLYRVGITFNKVVVDKVIETISIRRTRFFFWRRVIPLSDVMSVDVDYTQKLVTSGFPGWSGWRDAWSVSLYCSGKRIRIDHTTNKANMVNLANNVSEFIGKKLLDKSAKPKSKVEKVSLLNQPWK